jgi:CRP-like cAMP-binding protein
LGPYIRSIGVGEVFGDRGILGKRCRQTTVIADSSTVRCMKITRKKFSEFTKLMPSLAAQPEVVWQLIQTHAERRSEQEKNELLVQLQRLPALSALPPDVISDIAAASRGGSFNVGDMVFPVDDESRYFGIILEGEMASFCRDEASLAAFPGMQVHTFEASNKLDQERFKTMQQRYGTLLQKFSHGSIVGVGALWLPETTSVARLENAALSRGKSVQDSVSEGIPTVFETITAKGSRVRRIMSFVSMSKGLQVIIVDSQALTMAKAILKNTESFIPSQLLASLERRPHLRSAHEHLSLTAYLLTFKYCQRLPATTVSDFARHVEVSLRKKGECVQRQGMRPSSFIMPLKGSISLFRVPPPPNRDDDDDEDDLRWVDGEQLLDDDRERTKSRGGSPASRTKSRGGSPASKGPSSRHGSKRMSPSPPRTAALAECAIPSTADTDHGAPNADDAEDFAGIFGDKIGSVSVGAPVDELALVLNALSPFTAVVASHVARLFILPPSVYAKLLQRFHKEELSKLCKDIIQSVPVFRSWPLPKVMNLIRYFEPKEYFRGQKLMSQVSNRRNDQRRIMLVLEGSCAVEADLPRSSEHTVEGDIKLRQKEELEEQSLRELALSSVSSPKVESRKLRHIKRAVITVFGQSTVLLDGFAAQPLSYDVVAIERVMCLELSGEEFNKVSNSTLEYIAEQEAMTNSWRSSVVAKLAVIRAPDFALSKPDTDVDVDSIVAAINAKKKAELLAAKERSCSPNSRQNRPSPARQSGSIEGPTLVNSPLESKLATVSFGQRAKYGPRAHEATLPPNYKCLNQDPVPPAVGTPTNGAHGNTSSSLDGSNWWQVMGIEGMEGKGGIPARQSYSAAAPAARSAAVVDSSTRENARAAFGVKVEQDAAYVIAPCINQSYFNCETHALLHVKNVLFSSFTLYTATVTLWNETKRIVFERSEAKAGVRKTGCSCRNFSWGMVAKVEQVRPVSFFFVNRMAISVCCIHDPIDVLQCLSPSTLNPEPVAQILDHRHQHS